MTDYSGRRRDRALGAVLARARGQGRAALIVDVKSRSPRDGELIPGHRLESFVQLLLDSGVDALATVTESRYFGGSLDTARRIRALSGVPLMRKDFFTSVAQIDESYELGFDAVHLTLRTIGDLERVRAMQTQARALGMDAVIGVHSGHELTQATALEAAVIGINNRDITALELDGGTVSRSEALAALTPRDVYVISESGLRTTDDVARAARAGADGVLIGTAVSTSPDPAALVRALGQAAWKG